MKRLVLLLAAVLVLAPIPAHADAPPPCSPIAHEVVQVPSGVEHYTTLHSGAHTLACSPSTWAQVTATIQRLEPDGTWSNVVSATSPPKWISSMCRTSACRSASVVVDRNPCISGTFRAVATASGATNIGPTATLVCYQDPPQ